MADHELTISDDEALVLSEFFRRFDDSERLYFVHHAEYIALMRVAGQIDKTTAAVFRENYEDLLRQARERVAAGYESGYPVLEEE